MIYSAIFNSNTIIAEYSEEGGDFNVTLAKLLKANRQPLEFYVIPFLNYECFFLHKDEYTFGSICQQNLDNEKVLLFLQALKFQFINICLKEKDNLTLKTTNIIRELMLTHGDNLLSDKFEKIENTLKGIKKEKMNLVEQILEKEVLLETVINKSDNLKRQSFSMKTNFEKKLKKNTSSRTTFYILVFIFLLIFIFIVYYISLQLRNHDNITNLRSININKKKFI